MNKLAVNKICKSFKQKKVLEEISFQCENEILFIAGRNGAGKTTFIRLALGLEKATSGTITYNGMPFKKVREAVSVVFDETCLFDSMTGAQNINILASKHAKNIDYVNYINQQLQLDERLLKQKVAGYSFGQRHRLSVAIAMIKKSCFLFLDEPTIGLDPVSWEAIKNSLLEFKKAGGCIILTGQDYAEMRELADSILVLHEGKVIYHGRIDNFMEKYPSDHNLKKAFLTAIGGDNCESVHCN